MRACAALTAIAMLGSTIPASAHAQAAYPAVAVLDAARKACAGIATIKGAKAQLAKAGWTKVADPSTSPVGPILSYGIMAGEHFIGDRGSVGFEMPVYRKIVAGEELWLILSDVNMDGVAVHGCRIYDPGEERRIEPAAATRWMGRVPSKVENRPVLTRVLWEPGAGAGQDSFELFHIPAASPARELVKITGIAIKADWVGKP